MIGKHYFALQAVTLLRFAKSTNDPAVAAALVEKAADLKFKGDEPGVLAPDIEQFVRATQSLQAFLSGQNFERH
jgi:hypothetical protein